MRRSIMSIGVASAALVASACAATPGWSNADALAANRLEIQVDRQGRMTEIEHHIDPAAVPAAVRAAMDALHPGGPFTDAEKETHGGLVYYELNRVVGGMEVEAMFTPDGQLYSEEIQVDASSVPANVQSAAAAAVPGGTITAWEEIHDGNRALTEYHVKTTEGSMKWKLAISAAGQLLGTWREVPAEVEVPR